MYGLFAKSYEYTDGRCYVDGIELADASACTAPILIVVGVLIAVLIIGLLCAVLWVFTLRHLLRNADVPDRTAWLAFHIVAPPFAAVLYFFIVMRAHKKKKSQQAGPIVRY